MRHIDLDDVRQIINSKEDWDGGAEDALSEARKASKKDRAGVIDKKSTIWRNLKADLMGLSDQKCWYCETKDLGADNAVDHYRPKNRVRLTTGEYAPGYWWLAFDWRNYRFSCQYCNSKRTTAETSGGKHDYFPILKEKNRGAPEAKTNQLDAEQPLLLDPTKPADIRLITFEKDGSAVPTYGKKKNEFLYQRAKQSIDLYHLQLIRKKKERARIWAEVEGHLEKAEPHRAGWEEGKLAATTAYNDAISPLRKLIARDAEFQGAAKAALRAAQGKPDPIGKIALDVLTT